MSKDSASKTTRAFTLFMTTALGFCAALEIRNLIQQCFYGSSTTHADYAAVVNFMLVRIWKAALAGVETLVGICNPDPFSEPNLIRSGFVIHIPGGSGVSSADQCDREKKLLPGN